ncbi:MAG: hypothetical protein AAB545_00300 [Patescibacteria group bacterium]
MFGKRTDLYSNRMREKRKSSLKKKFTLSLITFFTFFGGGVYLLNQDRFLIHTIVVEGVETLPSEEIKTKTNELLTGKELLLIPHKSAFFYPKKNLLASLKEAFPKISSVSVKVEGFNTLYVIISERKPAAVLCGNAGEKACVFVDADGFAFANAPDFSGSVFLEYNASGTENMILGEQAILQEEFRPLQFFAEELRKSGFPLKRIVFLDESQSEGYFTGGGKILFDRKTGLNDAWTSFETLVSSNALDKVKNASGGFTVQYIDLRNGNKIYYKP